MTTVYSYSAGSPRARARMAVTRYKCAACTYIYSAARRTRGSRCAARASRRPGLHYRGENERSVATTDMVQMDRAKSKKESRETKLGDLGIINWIGRAKLFLDEIEFNNWQQIRTPLTSTCGNLQVPNCVMNVEPRDQAFAKDKSASLDWSKINRRMKVSATVPGHLLRRNANVVLSRYIKL